MKILLVDDHQLFREGVALLLKRLTEGLDLLQAASCEEAFVLCDAHSDIDVLLVRAGSRGVRSAPQVS
jgi:DNA-binding NarL/FixJ family response regulator